jgi:drug/metabolite transporter (DMT)-like permease
MVLNYILGVVAALSAPLIMTIGFYIWDGLWSGSSLGLNIFKGTLATVIFLIIIGIINLASNQIYFQHQGTNEDIGWIVLSAFIGITIGDTCWLQSMAMIGARRVIIVDVTKPFLAAIIGFIGLNEPITPLLFVGLFLTMSGVGIVSFEQTAKKKKDCDTVKEQTATKISTKEEVVNVTTINVTTTTAAEGTNTDHCLCCSRLVGGYLFACLNVLFDVFGSYLTRKFGAGLTTFDINAIRFGSSACTLILISTVPYLFYYHNKRHTKISLLLYGKYNWMSNMSYKNWSMVSIGVMFVTVACPALSNWALFQLPLGICLCLTSTGPLYAIPISYFFKKEKITKRTIFGSILAIIGVVVLQLTKA